MELVGVMDIRGGRAVHARRGPRATYQPVASVAGAPIAAGDPRSVANAYVALGLTQIYVADLDAIEGREANHDAVAAVIAAAPLTWLDGGITARASALAAAASGASRIVIGLETLDSFRSLEAICSSLGSRRVVFSLDLRDGVPLVAPDASFASLPAESLASRAAASGAGQIVVLDLGRVGMPVGCDLDLLGRIRSTVSVPLFAGGGIRHRDDLDRLTAIGCDGALVATALLNGTIGGDRRNREF